MPELFGCYRVLPGRKTAHYFLPGAGAALCGFLRHERAVRAFFNPSLAKLEGELVSRVCPRCKELNELRWLHIYDPVPVEG